MIKWRKGWFPAWYAFCPTEADFKLALSKSLDPSLPYPEFAGCCVAYDDNKRERRILVTLNVDWDGEPQVAMGVLVHECVHVTQWIVKAMMDPEPSDEFQAYTTQAIFCELLNDIAEWRKRSGTIGALQLGGKKLD